MTVANRRVSLVFSFRNEAANLPELVSRVEKVFDTQPEDYEMIFVNDCSVDESLELLAVHHQRNPRIKYITMSRQFGVGECVRAGMSMATGDAVIYMDTDLQDPPEVIPKLLEAWRAGAQIVHTVRLRRIGEHPFKTWCTKQAYRLIQFGATIELPVEAGDFKLLSRVAVNHFLSLRESDPYVRGLLVWIGFLQVTIPYERAPRNAGRTHFPIFSRNPWKTLISGLTSFSFMPIYLCGFAAAAGFLVAFLTLLAAPLALVLGARTLGLCLAIGGMVLLLWSAMIGAMAAVGVYVIRIYKDVRGRPQYIIESSVGFK